VQPTILPSQTITDGTQSIEGILTAAGRLPNSGTLLGVDTVNTDRGN